MCAYHTGKEKKPFGEWVLEMLVRVITMAAFVLVVTPVFIAPALGFTLESYQANGLLWTVVSLVLGYVAAWPFSKLITRSIRSRGVAVQ